MFSSREWLLSFTEKTNRCIEVSVYKRNPLITTGEQTAKQTEAPRDQPNKSIHSREKITHMLLHNAKICMCVRVWHSNAFLLLHQAQNVIALWNDRYPTRTSLIHFTLAFINLSPIPLPFTFYPPWAILPRVYIIFVINRPCLAEGQLDCKMIRSYPSVIYENVPDCRANRSLWWMVRWREVLRVIVKRGCTLERRTGGG